MRYLKKRLVVLNDQAKSKKSKQERMEIVRNRYYAKMNKRGWIPRLRPCQGNAFFYWENYVFMCKPKNDKEKEQATENAFDLGFSMENGAWKL